MALTTQNWDFIIERRQQQAYRDYKKKYGKGNKPGSLSQGQAEAGPERKVDHGTAADPSQL